DDVRPYITAATAVVLPSYREGLPRSLLEAAAMARPLIATDVPGNRHIVRDGYNGLLCAARDPTELAKAMTKMGAMPIDERHAMGQAGRELVESEFGEARVIRAYLEAVAQLCPTRGS
ncbi:MAG TPA: glycosyltransferase, partial [Sphingomicrobium sp.]|nr:glycosyltransferase [Sphingomicrobium sp.]